MKYPFLLLFLSVSFAADNVAQGTFLASILTGIDDNVNDESYCNQSGPPGCIPRKTVPLDPEILSSFQELSRTVAGHKFIIRYSKDSNIAKRHKCSCGFGDSIAFVGNQLNYCTKLPFSLMTAIESEFNSAMYLEPKSSSEKTNDMERLFGALLFFNQQVLITPIRVILLSPLELIFSGDFSKLMIKAPPLIRGNDPLMFIKTTGGASPAFIAPIFGLKTFKFTLISPGSQSSLVLSKNEPLGPLLFSTTRSKRSSLCNTLFYLELDPSRKKVLARRLLSFANDLYEDMEFTISSEVASLLNFCIQELYIKPYEMVKLEAKEKILVNSAGLVFDHAPDNKWLVKMRNGLPSDGPLKLSYRKLTEKELNPNEKSTKTSIAKVDYEGRNLVGCGSYEVVTSNSPYLARQLRKDQLDDVLSIHSAGDYFTYEGSPSAVLNAPFGVLLTDEPSLKQKRKGCIGNLVRHFFICHDMVHSLSLIHAYFDHFQPNSLLLLWNGGIYRWNYNEHVVDYGYLELFKVGPFRLTFVEPPSKRNSLKSTCNLKIFSVSHQSFTMERLMTDGALQFFVGDRQVSSIKLSADSLRLSSIAVKNDGKVPDIRLSMNAFEFLHRLNQSKKLGFQIE